MFSMSNSICRFKKNSECWVICPSTGLPTHARVLNPRDELGIVRIEHIEGTACYNVFEDEIGNSKDDVLNRNSHIKERLMKLFNGDMTFHVKPFKPYA